MQTLDQLEKGMQATITAVGGTPSITQRLLAMGLLPGQSITIVAVAPLGDPITVHTPSGRLSLRLADAASIEIDRPGKASSNAP